MKNLCLNFVNLTPHESEVKPEACCISMNILFIISKHQLLAFHPNYVRHVCDLLQLREVQDNLNSTPAHMEVCSATGHIVLCLTGGELLIINVESGSAEYVGCVVPGINAAAWSPGADFLAVVTTALNLVILSQDLDPLTETELSGSTEEQPVSVGWGRKETQFRGSEGKLKSEAPIQEVMAVHDDSRVRVSWRGDGECLAVTFRDGDQRHIKVFSNDGTLLHSNEPTTGLESALCWRPNGAIIASTQRLPTKHIVRFFEKNLLPHGGFQLPDECIVHELSWNSDSSILAVLWSRSNDKKSLVTLFTVGNYHWYQKTSIILSEGESAELLVWDTEDPFTLHMISYTGQTIKHYRWCWRWATESSSGVSEDDQSWVAVVDGCQLLLTAFRKAVIPPPMCSATLDMSSPINAVGFLQHGAENGSISSNYLFVQCCDGLMTLFKYAASENRHIVLAKGKVPDCVLFQTSWVASDCLLACALTPIGTYQLVTLRINETSQQLEVSTKSLPEPLLAIRRFPGTDVVLLWHQSHCLKAINVKSLEECDWLEPIPRLEGRLLSMEASNKILALDSTHRLHAGEVTIARNVTSFRVTEAHLLATTLQHKLLVWPLSDLTASVSERAVERGSRIITAIPGSSSVVLQLPRGNLEVVLPRALTVTTLKTLLDVCNFSAALTLMRRERVNLNLLYDHNPHSFKSHVELFVQSIADPLLLCNFIAELNNENVTQTLYSTFYPPSVSSPLKVDLICSLLLSTFESREDKAIFLLPELSCLVKKGDTEKALVRVQSILADEKLGSREPVSSAEGLAHILYLVDLEQLFKIALGTYDLSLVMFIASKSQKDPKEYLPFLSGLQQMEENYQKFTIDNFLKRYKKALGHLALCPNRVTECLEFVTKHNLYRAALHSFARDTDTWKAVCVEYGAELTRQSRHEEAGLMLQRAGEFLLAQHAFARAGAWRRELACAEALCTPAEQMITLFRTTAHSLLSARRYTEAAQLFFDHIKDVASGVAALCNGQLHEEAIHAATLHGREDLIKSSVKPSTLSACTTYDQSITEYSEAFMAYFARLLAVRLEREMNGAVDWDDTASESSRGSSSGSSRASSTRSAKNSRKLERNLLKKGGPYEEVALVAALHDVITQTVALKSQVRTLNLTLVALDEEMMAARLQNCLHEFLEKIKAKTSVIWPAPNSFHEHVATSNSIAAAFNATRQLLPAPVQALQPKILFAPDLCSGLEWQLDILFDK